MSFLVGLPYAWRGVGRIAPGARVSAGVRHAGAASQGRPVEGDELLPGKALDVRVTR